MRARTMFAVAALSLVGLWGCGKEEPPAAPTAPAAPAAPTAEAPAEQPAEAPTEGATEAAQPQDPAIMDIYAALGSSASNTAAPAAATKTPDELAGEAFTLIRAHLDSGKVDLAADLHAKVERLAGKLSPANVNQIEVLRGEIEAKGSEAK